MKVGKELRFACIDDGVVEDLPSFRNDLPHCILQHLNILNKFHCHLQHHTIKLADQSLFVRAYCCCGLMVGKDDPPPNPCDIFHFPEQQTQHLCQAFVEAWELKIKISPFHWYFRVATSTEDHHGGSSPQQFNKGCRNQPCTQPYSVHNFFCNKYNTEALRILGVVGTSVEQ